MQHDNPRPVTLGEFLLWLATGLLLLLFALEAAGCAGVHRPNEITASDMERLARDWTPPAEGVDP